MKKNHVFILLIAIIITSCASYFGEMNISPSDSEAKTDSIYIYGSVKGSRNILYLERNNNKFMIDISFPLCYSFGYGRWWHYGDSLILYGIPEKEFFTMITHGYGGLDHSLMIGIKRDDSYIIRFNNGIVPEDSIFHFKCARVMDRHDSAIIFPPYPYVIHNGRLTHIDSISTYR